MSHRRCPQATITISCHCSLDRPGRRCSEPPPPSLELSSSPLGRGLSCDRRRLRRAVRAAVGAVRLVSSSPLHCHRRCLSPPPPSMVQSPLLHLVHSSSGAPTAMSSSEVRTPSQRVTVACSKSTSKPRPKSSGHNGDGDEDNTSGNVSLATLKRRQQSNPSGLVVSRTTRSAPPSPSAWALSPGQSLLWAGSLAMEVSSGFNAPRASTKKPESKTNGGGGNGGAVSKVLKYFKPKRKVSPVQEEEIHKLRILHSSLLQWRKLSVLRENFSTFKMKFLKFDIH